MITGVVLARNEEAQIVECLTSLRPHVDEVLLIDMESSDKTAEAARPLVDRILTAPVCPNFDSARNLAIPAAKYDWLWFLDADERILPETGRLVRNLVQSRGSEAVAITIPFKTHFCERWIQHSGWWPGYTMPRVLKRGFFRFVDRLHGGVEFDGPELRLPPDPNLAIEHFSYRSISHYIDKFNRYTTTEAINGSARVPYSWETGIREMVRDLWAYYEAHEGQKDGLHGWILAWLAGQYRWFSHSKLLDINPLEAPVGASIPPSLDHVVEVMRDELTRRRQQNYGMQLAVRFRTPLFDPSGYAEDGRTVGRAWASGKRIVCLEDLQWSRQKVPLPVTEQALFNSLTRTAIRSPYLAVTNCIPTLCAPDPGAAYNVLRTTFETDRIPDGWLPLLHQYDEVWVLSQHNARSFRQSGFPPERIKVLPGFIDCEVFQPDGPQLSLPEPLAGRFVFLSILDWQLRKGWDVLLRAYCQAFSPVDGAGLLMKVSRQHGYSIVEIKQQASAVLASLGMTLADRHDIVFWEETLPHRALAALYRSVQAFVLPSRGEGWGRPLLEALASGTVTIGAAGSGSDDFLTPERGVVVPSELKAVSDAAAREISVFRDHRWWEPDERCLQATLHDVFHRHEFHSLRARNAVAEVRQQFSLEAAREHLEALAKEIESRVAPLRLPEPSEEALTLVLEGELFANHSFSNINESLALEWAADPAIALSIQRRFLQPAADAKSPNFSKLRSLIDRTLPRTPDVTVRHAFPPNWSKPPSGKWVHIQPWEFGFLPVEWLPALQNDVDEIWAPSNYVRDVYIASGVAESKIHVIPWGVDPEVYTPAAPPLHLATTKSFKVLFMGGTIRRKGFDVLLEAYLDEFKPEDDICLVVKDLGSDTFYRFDNGKKLIENARRLPGAAEILQLSADMTDGTRASLYTACNVLAAPYRGEGFGLPVLEAMGCGLPVVIPRGGPTDDFTDDEVAFRLEAETVETNHDLRLVRPATEFRVRKEDVRRALREAYDNQQETARRGQLASAKVRVQYTWRQTTKAMTNRLHILSRSQKAAVSPTFRDLADVVPVRLPISACLVVHNSERNLAECLAEIRPHVSEIVVVDAGSHDRTTQIAVEYGASVFTARQAESSAALINAAIERSSSPWILLLHPDERLEDDGWKELARVFQRSPEADAFSVKATPMRNGGRQDIRLFRRDERLRFRGQDEPSLADDLGRYGLCSSDLPVTVLRSSQSAISDIPQDKAAGNGQGVENQSSFERLRLLGEERMGQGNYFHAECYLHDAWQLSESNGRPDRGILTCLLTCYVQLNDPWRADQVRSALQQVEITQ